MIKHRLHRLKTQITQIIIFLSSVFCLLSSVCFAQQAVSSTELIERAREFDGREIVYEGEAVGEVMARKAGAWVNLHDGENAIGIWGDNNFLNQISYTGSYRARGDWLQIRGIFNRACPLHGGDLDIHGLNVIKLREGRFVTHRLVPQKQRLVIILLGVFLCLLILSLLSRKPKKK